MRNSFFLSFILLLLASCFQNPLGSKGSSISDDFHPGLDSPPRIISISPNQGAFVGGTNITITGSGFQNGATIRMGTSLCVPVTYVSSSTLTCITPANAMGMVDVIVKNPDDQRYSLADGFNYITNIAGVPGLGVLSGGDTRIMGASMSMEASIGEPFSGEVMSGATFQLRPGIQGGIFTP